MTLRFKSSLLTHKKKTPKLKQRYYIVDDGKVVRKTAHSIGLLTLDMLPDPDIPKGVYRFKNADGSAGHSEVLLGANFVFD